MKIGACPSCGSSPKKARYLKLAYQKKILRYSIECGKCGYETKPHLFEVFASMEWNRKGKKNGKRK